MSDLWGEFKEHVVDPTVDAFQSGVETAEDLLRDMASTGEDLVSGDLDEIDKFLDSAGDAYDAFTAWASDTGSDIGRWAERQWEKAEEVFRDAAEALGEAIERAEEAVKGAVSSLVDAVTRGVRDLAEAFDALVDWAWDHLTEAAEWFFDEALPTVWGVLKLAAILLVVTAMLPFFLASIIICSFVSSEYGHKTGTLIENILDNDSEICARAGVQRIPAGAKYFISSDLHLYSAGELDTPEDQNTKKLYRGLLQYYAAQGYGLIENGDVEDYWLHGGSGYGVICDLAEPLPSPAVDNAFVDGATGELAQVHLVNILSNNSATYSTISQLFHQRGMYYRTVGNHDDANGFAAHQDILRRVYPDLVFPNIIVLDDGGKGVGFVAHGHQTDAWNNPACSYLGKLATSVASAVRDVSHDAWGLGVPGQARTSEIFGSRWPNEMREVNPVFGVRSDLGSLNEVRLFKSFQRTFGGGVSQYGLDGGPYIILGHTHNLCIGPGDPDGYYHWDRYFNGGCGIFRGAVTGIEWDGTQNAWQPTVRVVAWRYDPADPEQKLQRATLDRYVPSGYPLPPSAEDTKGRSILNECFPYAVT